MPKSVFITGAAAGIGRATALKFAARGYTVGGYDLNEAGLASLADDIAAAGGAPLTGRLDVTDYDEFAARLAEFTEAAGGLNVLVNNAGILFGGRLQDIDPADHRRLIDVNCKGVVNGCQAALPALRATGDATVVNLCSASAMYGQPELAVYSATKFFVRGLTEALDLEWGEYGIRVIAMWPLFVQTAMVDGLDIGSLDTTGVHLNADDVAAAIVSAVEPDLLARLTHRVHYSVGLQTELAATLSRFSPSWATRLLHKFITRS